MLRGRQHVQSLCPERPRSQTAVKRNRPYERTGKGFFDLPAVFGGPARNESRNYWIKQEGAETVIELEVERFGEKDKVSGHQKWEDVPAGSALKGSCYRLRRGKPTGF